MTATGSSRAVTLLEETLEEVKLAIADCFAAARAIVPAADEYGHQRAREIQNATELLKMSAELGLALARIKGEFNHNITVAHDGAGKKRKGGTPSLS